MGTAKTSASMLWSMLSNCRNWQIEHRDSKGIGVVGASMAIMWTVCSIGKAIIGQLDVMKSGKNPEACLSLMLRIFTGLIRQISSLTMVVTKERSSFLFQHRLGQLHVGQVPRALHLSATTSTKLAIHPQQSQNRQPSNNSTIQLEFHTPSYHRPKHSASQSSSVRFLPATSRNSHQTLTKSSKTKTSMKLKLSFRIWASENCASTWWQSGSTSSPRKSAVSSRNWQTKASVITSQTLRKFSSALTHSDRPSTWSNTAMTTQQSNRQASLNFSQLTASFVVKRSRSSNKCTPRWRAKRDKRWFVRDGEPCLTNRSSPMCSKAAWIANAQSTWISWLKYATVSWMSCLGSRNKQLSILAASCIMRRRSLETLGETHVFMKV